MKKNILLLIIFFSSFAFSQEVFYRFSYEEKDGLTDHTGKEIIAPIYSDCRESKDKKLLIFRPDFMSDEETYCFDVETKQGKKYKTFYEDEVTVQKIQHHFVEELTGKKYLLNSQTGEIISFKEDIYNSNDLNDYYIIAKYFPKEITTSKVSLQKKPSKKVKGKIQPPAPMNAPESNSDYYVIYSSTNDLKPVFKTRAMNYFLLNKEIPSNKTYEKEYDFLQTIKRDKNNFDFILFANNEAYQLYDKNFKLIKKFTSKSSNSNWIDEEVLKICETISGSKIKKKESPIVATGSDDSERTREEPKFKIERDTNMYYLINKNKKILSSPHKLKYSTKGNLWIENEKTDNSTYFQFNENTFQMYIPKIYLEKLGVEILNY